MSSSTLRGELKQCSLGSDDVDGSAAHPQLRQKCFLKDLEWFLPASVTNTLFPSRLRCAVAIMRHRGEIEMKIMRTTLALFLVLFFLIAREDSHIAFSQTSSKPTDSMDSPSRAVGSASFRGTVSRGSSANSAREHLRRLTAEPHVAGTKEDYATAIYVRDQIRSYGIPAELKEYDVLLPYPKLPSIVEIIGRRRERLAVKEAVIPEDPTSSNPRIIPLFNGYSPSGDVTAPLVYVNYGLPPDYEALKKLA